MREQWRIETSTWLICGNCLNAERRGAFVAAEEMGALIAAMIEEKLREGEVTPTVVIPAKAGIHGCGRLEPIRISTTVDPGLRRDDEHFPGTFLPSKAELRGEIHRHLEIPDSSGPSPG